MFSSESSDVPLRLSREQSTSLQAPQLEAQRRLELAPEVLLEVIKHALPGFRTTAVSSLLLNLSLVCQSWYSVAQSEIYRFVDILKSTTALLFIRTLDSSRHGELVRDLRIGRMAYTLQEVFHVPASALEDNASHRSVIGADRLIDAVARNCPNLSSLSIARIYSSFHSISEIPTPGPPPNIFSQLECLRIDAQLLAGGRPHWLAKALYTGALHMPNLRTLVWQGGTGTSGLWCPLPSLRTLHIVASQNPFFSPSPSDQPFRCLLSDACPSDINELSLSALVNVGRLVEEQVNRFSHLRVLEIESSCDVEVHTLITLLKHNAHCLEAFSIGDRTVRMDPTDTVAWPRLNKLRRLQLNWASKSSSAFLLVKPFAALISAIAISSVLRELRLSWIQVNTSHPPINVGDLAALLTPVKGTLQVLEIREARVALEPHFNLSLLGSVLEDMKFVHTLELQAQKSNVTDMLIRLPPNLKTLYMRVFSWMDDSLWGAILDLIIERRLPLDWLHLDDFTFHREDNQRAQHMGTLTAACLPKGVNVLLNDSEAYNMDAWDDI